MAKKDTHHQKHLKALGNRLRSIRKELGYSSAEKFAYAKDLNRVQYSRYETGVDLQFTSLLKILEAFEMSVEEFFSEGFEEADRKSSEQLGRD